jgi:hypothetical protein
MADQRVVVFDYDPEWPARFAEQRPLVEELLRPWRWWHSGICCTTMKCCPASTPV